jgi:molecular chaperone DnaK
VRQEETGQRVPHYLIPANSPLPASATSVYGTVVQNQRKVHVWIVESGAGSDRAPTVLGDCRISGLPADLPEGTEIEVTLSYDHQARVHVTAREPVSGAEAEIEILRSENLREAAGAMRPAAAAPASAAPSAASVKPPSGGLAKAGTGAGDQGLQAKPVQAGTKRVEPDEDLLDVFQDLLKSMEGRDTGVSEQPILLCEKCQGELGRGGRCTKCGAGPVAGKSGRSGKVAADARVGGAVRGQSGKRPVKRPVDPSEQEFWDRLEGEK